MTKKIGFFNFFTVILLVFASVTFMGCDQLLDFLLNNTGTTDVEITNMISGKTFYSIKLDPVDSYMLAKEATSISLAYGKTHTFSNVAEGDFKVYVKTSSSGDYLLTDDGKVLTVTNNQFVARTVKKITELNSNIKVTNNSSKNITIVQYRESESSEWGDISLNVSIGNEVTQKFPAGSYYLRFGYYENGDFQGVYRTTTTKTFTKGSTTTITFTDRYANLR